MAAARALFRPFPLPGTRPGAGSRQSVRQNATAMAFSQGLTWLITALTLALLPRYFGPQQMGRVALGLSYADIAGTVAGMGMATLITRELARDRERGAELLGTALWLNVSLGLVAAIVVALVGDFAGYDHSTQLVIMALSITVPFNLVSLLAFGALQGLEVMRYQAFFDTAGKLSQLAVTLGVIGFGLGLPAYLAASIFCTVVFALPTMVIVWRHAPFRARRPSFRLATSLVARGIPFCSANVLLVLYLAVDAVLLSVLASERAVGIYGPASRIFGTLLFGPTIVMTVMFPRLAATARNDPGAFVRLADAALRAVLGITAPVAAFAIALSAPLLALLLGDQYGQTPAVMAVLALALIPTSINMIAHRVLVAVDRQRAWTSVMAVSLVAKVVLAIVSIELADRLWDNPALGAAVALLAVEAGMAVVGLALVPHGVANRALAVHGGRLLAAAATGGAVATLAPLPWALAGMVGGLSFAVAVIAFRAYTIAEACAGARWLLGNAGGHSLPSLPPFEESTPAEPALLFAPGRLKAVRAARRSPQPR